MILPGMLVVVFLVSVFTSLAVASRLTKVTVTARRPEQSRQWSASGTPRLGGVAVFSALAVGVFAAAGVRAAISGTPDGLPALVDALILSAGVLFVVGLLDDIRGVRPLAKLAAQTAAAFVIYAAGFSVEHVSLMPGYTIHLDILAAPV